MAKVENVSVSWKKVEQGLDSFEIINYIGGVFQAVKTRLRLQNASLSDDNYQGIIIEESLENKAVLKKVKILSTKVKKVTPQHQTPWILQWTLHTVEISGNKAKEIAEEIRESLDSKHGGSWYADFKNSKTHYIIFRNRIFIIDRTNKNDYDKAKKYGLSLGIPEYQVDFHPDIKAWES